MGRIRRAWLTALISLLIVADLAVLGVWATRPIRIYSEWLGLVGQQDESPMERLRLWGEWRLAPRTLSGLASVFSWEEVAVGGALLLAPPTLAILLATAWSDRWRAGPLATRLRSVRLPRVRLRVATSLALVAIAALGLGWEVNGWRYWRLRVVYLQHAENATGREASWRKQEEEHGRQLAVIESPRYIADNDGAHTAEAARAEQAVDSARLKEDRRRLAAQADEAGRLRRKYTHAADHPWEAVDPDSSLPEPLPTAEMLVVRGEFGRALADLDVQIAAFPDYADAHRHRAWILATCPSPEHRDGKAAVAAATRACELTRWLNGFALATLAAAHAEAGDFEEAVRRQRAALEHFAMSDRFGNDLLARMALYEAGKPFRSDRLRIRNP